MSCNAARELLTFWLAGSLSPGEAEHVARHLEDCAACRAEAVEGAMLIDGLRTLHLRPDEVVAAAAGDLNSPHLLVCGACRDEVALLKTVNADLARQFSAAVRTRSWAIAIAVAAVVIIAVPLARYVRERLGPSAPAQTASAPQRTAPPPTITVEKASLMALASETIALRGRQSPRRALLDDLASALEPYQRDDFAESAARLDALRTKYPAAPEIFYYLGVCLVMLDRPTDAIAPLEDAVRLSSSPDEARFYLSVARVNAGQRDTGLAGLIEICSSRAEGAARACAALAQASGARRP